MVFDESGTQDQSKLTLTKVASCFRFKACIIFFVEGRMEEGYIQRWDGARTFEGGRGFSCFPYERKLGRTWCFVAGLQGLVQYLQPAHRLHRRANPIVLQELRRVVLLTKFSRMLRIGYLAVRWQIQPANFK